ncbi:radical SAM protein [Haliovirga abyssi]|uniref:Radical SAM protein n=1 Tax=Haliovirga abyssi TaxID=2996794 RepID=A0AAU9D5A9_9FUSO|nr:radical SAM protein [Haliovirga abyssi]BDU51266.1 radical SAM protein [Haliovirga abyssi]
MDMSLIHRQIKWRLGIKSPIVANIKIINVCNLNCKMCNPSIRSEKNRVLSTQEWKSKLLELKKSGIKIVVFEGGEPTLRKDIKEIINYSKLLKLYTITITNGVNDFSHINSDTVWISVDGTKEFHEKVRGENIYNIIKKNILANRDKNIVILSMINSFNQYNIKEFVEEFKEFPIYFNWLYGYKSTDVSSMSKEEKIESAEFIMKLKKEGYNIFNSYKTLKSVGKKKKCDYWLLTTVNSAGEQDNTCMVSSFDDSCDCNQCDLSCYLELNNIYNLDYQTRKNWEKMLGIDMTFKIEDLIFSKKE